MASDRTHDPVGSYGLRIAGLDGAAAAMQPIAAGAPPLTVVVTHDPPPEDPPSTVDAETADVRLLFGGRLQMRRGEDSVTFALPSPPSADDLLHPYLAPAAAIAQQWRGREALHAGVFVSASGGAVLLLGGKENGKSTTLTWLALHHRATVMADDLAVIENDHVHAGPRCLDVRVHAQIDLTSLGEGRLVRGAERVRMGLPPAPATVPIAAIVLLEWGPKARLTPVPLADRFRELMVQRMFHSRIPVDPHALLDLASKPMYRLSRPRGEEGLAAGTQLMLDRL